MRFSTSEDNASKGWGVTLSAVRDVRGQPLRIEFARPSWHSMIFYLGLLSLSRSVLTEADLHDSKVSATVYLLALPVALIVGQLVEKVKGPQIARILSATLGTAGTLVTALDGDVPAVVAVGVGAMYVLHGTGELLCLLCPQEATALGPRASRRRSRSRRP
jgi:hypothetical protein